MAPRRNPTKKKWKHFDTGPTYFEEVEGAIIEGEVVTITEPTTKGKKKLSGYVQVVNKEGAFRVNRCWSINKAITEGFLGVGTHVRLTFEERVDLGGGQEVKRWKIESR